MTRRMGVTNSARWRQKMAAEAHEDARLDWASLEPCAWCGGRHEPGRCEDDRERAEGESR